MLLTSVSLCMVCLWLHRGRKYPSTCSIIWWQHLWAPGRFFWFWFRFEDRLQQCDLMEEEKSGRVPVPLSLSSDRSVVLGLKQQQQQQQLSSVVLMQILSILGQKALIFYRYTYLYMYSMRTLFLCISTLMVHAATQFTTWYFKRGGLLFPGKCIVPYILCTKS